MPCISTEAIQALLSLLFDTWQSAQYLVSVARTVWGANVLKEWPLRPSAETVCCWEYTHSRVPFCEPTSTAHVERAGEMRLPAVVPSCASMNTSSRIVWKLYGVQLRSAVPSLWSSGFFSLAFMGRWQPKHDVTHEVWQEKHVMRLSACASCLSSAGASPQVVPSRRTVLDSRERSARLGFLAAHAEPGVIVSRTCTTSHSRSLVTVERWTSVSPRHWKRRGPNGVPSSDMSVPPAGAAGPDVFSVALALMVPWQSTQLISMAARVSP